MGAGRLALADFCSCHSVRNSLLAASPKYSRMYFIRQRVVRHNASLLRAAGGRYRGGVSSLSRKPRLGVVQRPGEPFVLGPVAPDQVDRLQPRANHRRPPLTQPAGARQLRKGAPRPTVQGAAREKRLTSAWRGCFLPEKSCARACPRGDTTARSGRARRRDRRGRPPDNNSR